MSCGVARMQDKTPRDVLDRFFRQSVADDKWRKNHAGLLD
jgi:hypothetical protein